VRKINVDAIYYSAFTAFPSLRIRPMDLLLWFAWTYNCGFIRCNCFQTL